MSSEAVPETMRAVQFDRFGGSDVLHVTSLPMPHPQEGEVLVEIRAAAINPGEAAIRQGYLGPATFPSGEGSDLSGVVLETGPGVTDLAPGDAVLGYSWNRSSHASHVVVPVTQLIRKPEQLSWEVAGAVYMIAVTATAAVDAVDPQPGDVIAVSAAAGGIGDGVTQLLVHRGATVLGIASPANADWLEQRGATPIAYGDGLKDRLTAAAPDGIDAFIDLFGPEYVELAADLGIDPTRIETIIAYEAAGKIGAQTKGSTDYSNQQVLQDFTDLVVAGTIQVEIAGTYPLDDVRAAFDQLEQRHTRGKLVLIP